jgi:hypothetical protein
MDTLFIENNYKFWEVFWAQDDTLNPYSEDSFSLVRFMCIVIVSRLKVWKCDERWAVL